MYSIMPYRRNGERMLARPMGDFIRSFWDMGDMFMGNGFRVDMREEENAYLLEAELPGVPKDKISLSLDSDVLTISADLNEEKKEEKDGYVYSERRSGHVQRSFSMEGIDPEAVHAAYENGVLTVTLPKQKSEDKPQARKIDIE